MNSGSDLDMTVIINRFVVTESLTHACGNEGCSVLQMTFNCENSLQISTEQLPRSHAPSRCPHLLSRTPSGYHYRLEYRGRLRDRPSHANL